MMILDNKYELFEIVYLITDTYAKPRIITKICTSMAGLEYRLDCGTEFSWHYEPEMTKEKSQVQIA